jgi:tetratricopeptide (TPR) repeat protein
LVACAVLIAAPTAFAQPVQLSQASPSSDLQRQYDAAFEQMVRQPDNLEVLFKFATLASQTGDLEGAISALERMLLVDPNLPRVRLELGVLYFRLGSYEVARTYLSAAAASPSAPPEVRSRAQEYLAEAEKRQSRSRFAGEVFAGMRYQSNANLGPAGSTVRLFGQSANLNETALGKADWGAVASGQLRHIYDLGTQDKAAIETQFTAYANRQFQLSAANVSLVDLTSGPRFQILQGHFEDVVVRPFLSGGYIWVNDFPYYGSYGAGVESAVLLTDRLRNISTVVWRQQNYVNSSYLPTNTQFTGVQYSANTTFQYKVNELVSLLAIGNAQQFQAGNTNWQSYMLWGAGGGLVFNFDDPVFKSELPWTISLFVTQQWWRYAAPDPNVERGTMRTQVDTILSILLAIPFDERTTFSISGGRFNRTASIENYAFTNNSFMFGVSWRF